MVYSQVSRNAPEVHTVDIQLHRLLPHCATVALFFRHGRILPPAFLAFVALTPGWRLSGSMLFAVCLTVWALVQTPILPSPTYLDTPTYFSYLTSTMR